jgi:hypothetical protein
MTARRGLTGTDPPGSRARSGWLSPVVPAFGVFDRLDGQCV